MSILLYIIMHYLPETASRSRQRVTAAGPRLQQALWFHLKNAPVSSPSWLIDFLRAKLLKTKMPCPESCSWNKHNFFLHI